jgi:Peptidase inhibitor I9
LRHLRAHLAVAAVVGGLVAPASAAAGQATYVVTLAPPPGTSCEHTILGVAASNHVVPTLTYTDAICGFSAPLSKTAARQLSADPRVVSVTPDSTFSASGG